MPRIIDYTTAPIHRRRVSITDEMADNVREILGRPMTADDVARDFDNDDDVQEVVRELIAEEIEEEPYPGWAMGLGVSESSWSDHYESVDRANRVRRKFAAKKAALTADYAKRMEKLEQQERMMMPVWSPQSRLIREITEKVYKGLAPDEVLALDKSLDQLKTLIRTTSLSDQSTSAQKSPAMPKMAPLPENDMEKASSSVLEFVEDADSESIPRVAMAM